MYSGSGAERVELDVVRQQCMGAGRNEETAVGGDPAPVETVDLLEEGLRTDHHAVAEDTLGALVQNPRRDQMECEVLIAELDGVARIVATLITRDDIERRAEKIYDLAK